MGSLGALAEVERISDCGFRISNFEIDYGP